MQIVNIVIYKR